MPRNRKRKAQAAQQPPARPATPPMPEIPEPEEEPKTRGWRSEDYVVLYAAVPKQLTHREVDAAYNPLRVFRMTAFADGSVDLVVRESEEPAKNPLRDDGPPVWSYLLHCFGGRKEFRVVNERPMREFLDVVMPSDLEDEDEDYP